MLYYGGTANSKLFQNVREKASLAYTASSSYVKAKNNIFIKCGIEIPNYEKAVKIIKEQLEDIKNGKFENSDIDDAKRTLISTIKTITEEQDTEIAYYFGQEISNVKYTLDEYENQINMVSKEQIQDLARKVKINTIYFLRD